MRHFRRAPGQPARLGIFPGTFNPVTIAHVALAEAALEQVDEVLFVLPRVFPHKTYSGASFEQRLDLLGSALSVESSYSIAASEGGLFLEIAEECRQIYGGATRLSFLCGADAAARISGWNYGDDATLARMLGQFDLLVAPRGEPWTPPAPAFRPLRLSADYTHVSATEVRERITTGSPWRHLVPEAIRDQVARIYAGGK